MDENVDAEWRVGTGEPNGGFKSVTAFYPEEAYTSSNGSSISQMNTLFSFCSLLLVIKICKNGCFS